MATQRIFYKVLYDFQAEEEGEMSVTQGTFVQTAGACSSYPVRRVQRQPDTHNNASPDLPSSQPAMRLAIPTPRSATRIHPCPHAFFPHALGSPPHSITHPSLNNNKQQTCVPYHSPSLFYPPSPPLTHVPSAYLSLS